MINVFEEIVLEIEEEYSKSKNNIGWRFLTVSKNSLSKNSGIFLITLNPGGDREDPKQGKESCESGCAYIGFAEKVVLFWHPVDIQRNKLIT